LFSASSRCEVSTDQATRVLADLPVAEHEHTFRKLGDVMFVSDQDNRKALVVQVLEKLQNLDRSAAIEIPGGFVGQKDGRTVHGARAMATRCCCPPDICDG